MYRQLFYSSVVIVNNNIIITYKIVIKKCIFKKSLLHISAY